VNARRSGAACNTPPSEFGVCPPEAGAAEFRVH